MFKYCDELKIPSEENEKVFSFTKKGLKQFLKHHRSQINLINEKKIVVDALILQYSCVYWLINFFCQPIVFSNRLSRAKSNPKKRY